ncbi:MULTISPECIES: RidA family protein [Paenibacillus]|uniref:Endoribonuclease L-PSP n=1 Tax=Paenibacillus naphthalenovorans TaxID=162209 RepID=A0A0U2VU13_9BACL|nr:MULTISPECIES: Rid family detoxifying hydrolase [Paenibacillus]ALS23015.1 endoribonuclease L-PSP [Paenibacillus naphthalenovorans]NTZ17388.1 RidA family protein [Paenibacillus sp. JMULE4]GCL71924.1 reactive intermediate/imine deaminase [Paenibacillus naphthalenovorans]SDI42686.1 2-iminobutanoate/2-iminopropanoate deaminase [Paenibacillus naphthalenovorans]
MKKQLLTRLAPAPAGPYSQGIQFGNTIYTAGQGPIDAETGKVQGDTIEEQTAKTLDNLKYILEQAGATFDDVVKVTVHLSDLGDFQAFNEVYKRYFKEPYPVRTTVGSQLLGIKVEIDAVAILK